jgi:uncharacterized protein (DUF1800 family)
MKRRFIVSLSILAFVVSVNAQPQPSAMTASAAARFLDQATWGPTPAAITELQRLGISGWLTAEFAANSSDLPDQPVLNASGKSNNDLRPVEQALIQNAVTGSDQLRQRVAFILSQIWVVSAESGVAPAYAYPPYWRIFRDNAFGNYRDIIKAVSLSPAMGRYLNMANNNKGNPAKGTSANENYARELLQVFTIGLSELNTDGTPVLDSNHNPVPLYDQTTIVNMAKLLTGWTYPTAPDATAKANNPAYYIGQMFAVPSRHDTSAKIIIGNTQVPAGQTAEQDLDSLLDALMNETTMAPFISQQLIEHMVTSNPSPAYVQRVANVFLNDGRGVRGDLEAVITAILTDPEARAGDDPSAALAPNFGHLREPLLLMTNLLRGLNATLTAKSAIYNETALLGENLFHEPSVFSYFSPQYRTPQGLLGPEFQIYSTQTAASRADIVNSLLYGRLDSGTTVDLSPFVARAGNTDTLLEYIGSIFLHGAMSPDLKTAAGEAADAAPTPRAKAQAALYVVLTSGEYQVMH